jgi:hypothetical protein
VTIENNVQVAQEALEIATDFTDEHRFRGKHTDGPFCGNLRIKILFGNSSTICQGGDVHETDAAGVENFAGCAAALST